MSEIYKGKLYNLGPGIIGTARPGQLIEDDLTKDDVKNLKALGLVSETPQEKADSDAEAKLRSEVAELKGRLVEKDAALEKAEKAKNKAVKDALKDSAEEIEALKGKVSDLEKDNAELKKLAGGK